MYPRKSRVETFLALTLRSFLSKSRREMRAEKISRSRACLDQSKEPSRDKVGNNGTKRREPSTRSEIIPRVCIRHHSHRAKVQKCFRESACTRLGKYGRRAWERERPRPNSSVVEWRTLARNTKSISDGRVTMYRVFRE